MADLLAVLVVEDELLLQMQLEGYLEDAGHQVAGRATSLQEALDVIDKTTIDVAFVDIHLKDGPTGLDVGCHLAREGIPFIFVTANAGRVPEDFCGGWGVIMKPYSGDAMDAAVRFIEHAVRRPPPPLPPPSIVQIAPKAEEGWMR